MSTAIGRNDPRYATLRRSRNLRWPASDAEAAAFIQICEDSKALAAALQQTVNQGRRPTIRSGGHCYEDFVVNNPGGTILDLSLLSDANAVAREERYRISPGMQLGDVYLDLYKRYGVTIPAGSCYSVGAGGHISGGGYGVLSRLYGLTVDWLSAVEILTVNTQGKVVPLRVDKTQHPDLFRASRGAGGGNFGVITSFLFDQLPPAPQEVVAGGLSFEWNGMTEDRFVDIVQTYGHYFETRGKDRDTWGLFSILNLSHASGRGFGIGLQFCNPDGTCSDLTPLHEFLALFDSFKPSRRPPVRRFWLDATVGDHSGSGGMRAKYKSAYMKRNFTKDEAHCIYKHLRRTPDKADLRGGVLAVDSYGGAVNRASLVNETSIAQRASTLKLQFMSFWSRPEDDAARLGWLRDFYSDLYTNANVDSRFSGTPYPGDFYEGCYINYPDADMLSHPFWPQLYYGIGELYPFLQGVKRRYDPNNVFHHAMSIRP